MTHEQTRELLLDLAYGELTADAAGEVARHAAECAACGAELQRITSTRALASALRDAPGPRTGREPLVAAARRALPARRRWFVRSAALSFGAAAATVAVVVGVTLQLTRPGAHRVEDDVDGTAPTARTDRPSISAAAPPSQAPLPGAARPPAPGAPSPRPPALDAPSPPPAAPRPPPRAVGGAAPQAPAAAGASAERRASAAPSVAPAPAPPMVADAIPPPRPARAPARSTAKAKANADADGAAAAPDIVAEVERRRAAGGLSVERRRLRCGDAFLERIALVASDGRIVQLTERAGGSVAEAWYDDAGRLRARRASGEDAPPLPRMAPSLDALASACAW